MAKAADKTIRFLGAAGTVTGSKFLLRCKRSHYLVDCGLFQGYKQLRARNWRSLPIKPSQIKHVILTHAHIDHSGWLPVLCREGFGGKILATPGTRDLCRHLLPDSGFIQEKDAEDANRHGWTKHKPAKPLYTKAEAEASLKNFRAVRFHEPYRTDHLELLFRHAGHIPGAATAQIDIGGTRIVFSGDLGNYNSATMPEPRPVAEADYLVVESTYGDRRRNQDDPETEIARIVNETVNRGGSVIIPAFAVGRTQLLLHHLNRLIQSARIPTLPVYLDSPLAINATEVFSNHPDDHRLSVAEAEAACSLPEYVRDVEGSKALDRDPHPKIIIAGSGMATGGRVIHHLKVYAPDERNTILFAGYQAGGTRGAKMVAGEKSVKIHGQYWPVKAQVENLDMLSAHADCDEIMRWLSGFEKPPRKTFIVHGESAAADTLRLRIEEELGWDCLVPEHESEHELA
ncbi:MULTISPECIES: MBL fold metallo-hydrolase RNA specificity domain-containing protein [unclassified Wenzhouxiangella]|uniref:MBL fold metallo-hydrolase RNA specificity domain-containing protein n=1 Tax=unclassified Wenzhouxiangella TaxID=2613841 RepID=UPI000E326382|nr:MULTISPECIES: MBL fold metallo-hydrolase [unclassified Wenzhouxiangella]RFF26812.1 MBL fold metallo-hydrolase [Wenzhouxiangella sp. 15181]RFP67709.1 MBL fold metallo-hydrolase [Wenzhouxiangella sp. 15190]